MNPVLPRIIPRNEHRLSRKRVATNALTVLYNLKRHGYEAYLAGGGVRDLLLGREPKDFDVATDATPEQIRKVFRRCRLVGRRFRLAHVMFADGYIEVATFRAAASADEDPEAKPDDVANAGPAGVSTAPRFVALEGMIVRDNEYGSPAEDAVRRDFTINALFYDIRDFAIVDYVNGLEDLRRGLIRSIGDPEIRFVEDPVRMLRAVRFAAVLQFEIDAACVAAMQRHHNRLALAHPNRLFDEWIKMIDSGAFERMGPGLTETSLLSVLFPAFSAWMTADDARRQRFEMACHRLDMWRRRNGARVAVETALAVLMGEYFEDRIRQKTEDGLPWFPAALAVVSDTLAPGNTAMSIPKVIVQNTARLMAVQERFLPGYRGNRRRFSQQAVFAPALAVFQFLCESQKRPAELMEAWLEIMVELESGEAPRIRRASDKPGQGQGRPRRRRRRSGRRRPAPPA